MLNLLKITVGLLLTDALEIGKRWVICKMSDIERR